MEGVPERQVRFALLDDRPYHLVFETDVAGAHLDAPDGVIAMGYFWARSGVTGATGSAYALPTASARDRPDPALYNYNQFISFLRYVEDHAEILFILGAFERVPLAEQVRYLAPAVERPWLYENLVWPRTFQTVPGFPRDVRWHDGREAYCHLAPVRLEGPVPRVPRRALVEPEAWNDGRSLEWDE